MVQCAKRRLKNAWSKQQVNRKRWAVEIGVGGEPRQATAPSERRVRTLHTKCAQSLTRGDNVIETKNLSVNNVHGQFDLT